MSDLSPSARPDDVLPPPTLYDPADDKETPPGTDPAGAVVLLLVGEGNAAWAGRTAIELASTWARAGRRIVLADLHLENPVLHETIGDDDLEGLVDVFLYGVSITRSARPVPGRGFHLLPAGTYTSDVEGIYHHPRWAKLVAGFREAGATLVLFAPADGADVSALSRWASEAIVLGDLADGRALAPLASAGVRVRAHLVQPNDLPGVRAEGAAPTAPPPPASFVAPPPGEAQPRVPLVLVEPPGADRLRDDEDELHLPPPPMRDPPRRRPIYFALWLLLGVVVLALAGYVVGRLRPDLLPWPSMLADRPGADTTLAAIAADDALAAPARSGAPLPYSVQVIAFQSLPAAIERLATDRARVTHAPVYISPEEIGGIVYYKILAGALPDTTAARELRDSLVAEGVVNEQDAAGGLSLIQSTPLAFQLAEYPSQDAAAAAADSLQARNIPAYALPMPYSDSTYRWQLYAGAYRDTASSAPLRALLTSAGLTPALVTRSGRAAAGF